MRESEPPENHSNSGGEAGQKNPRPVRQEKRRKNPACGGPAWGLGGNDDLEYSLYERFLGGFLVIYEG